MTESYIYALVDPRTESTFYVGVTNDPSSRIESHVKQPANNDRLKSVLSDLAQQNLQPHMQVLEIVTDGNRASRERYWLLWYLKQGVDLCNISMLYHRGRRLSIETIENHGKWKRLNAHIRPDQDEQIERLVKEWDSERGEVTRKLLDIALQSL